MLDRSGTGMNLELTRKFSRLSSTLHHQGENGAQLSKALFHQPSADPSENGLCHHRALKRQSLVRLKGLWHNVDSPRESHMQDRTPVFRPPLVPQTLWLLRRGSLHTHVVIWFLHAKSLVHLHSPAVVSASLRLQPLLCQCGLHARISVDIIIYRANERHERDNETNIP